jgi:medium-chain acyl-[acyl-carrier-protein] hydrolase
MPGREHRVGETPVTDFSTLVELLVAEIEPLASVPIALFGHSLGALVAFEICRHLRERSAIKPKVLFVAARPAPQLPAAPPIYRLPPDRFLAAIQDRYGTFDDEIRHDQSLMKTFEPILRADFTLFDNYRYTAGPKLDCPIVALGGSADRSATFPALQAWSVQTSGEFTCSVFEGSHFFFDNDQSALRRLFREIICQVGELQSTAAGSVKPILLGRGIEKLAEERPLP